MKLRYFCSPGRDSFVEVDGGTWPIRGIHRMIVFWDKGQVTCEIEDPSREPRNINSDTWLHFPKNKFECLWNLYNSQVSR